MSLLRIIALAYAAALLGAAALNYVPGITDSEGRSFGVFALDTGDDLLHLASATWAGAAAAISHRASRFFLFWFGLLYLLDGVLGLLTGSGYLDLGILRYGIQDQPIGFRIMANLPHVGLGGFALLAARLLDRRPA